MDAKIKIGISNADSEAKYLNYARWIKGDDENIEIIKLSAIENNAERVAEIDALVLTGGIDTHPKFYRSNNLMYDHAPKIFNESRDVFEIKLFEQAQQKKIAVLGICRGMQLVNCILGGDLVQDNGINSNNIHKNDGKDKLHAIQIFANTFLNEITKTESSIANSAHHQSIHNLGKGLKVNAKSEDGIIEGLEWEDKTGKPFFLAVQWHPERMDQSELSESPLSKNIREYLLSDIKRNKK